MGFSGGGSNITKAHTHDSNIVQDGGALAANVTQFGLAAGSVLYSDGSNIQELGVGSATNVLTVNGAATAPEWAAAAGGGATLTRGYQEFTSSWSTTSTTFVDVGSGPLDITLQSGAGMALCFFESYMQSGQTIVAQWVFSTDGTQNDQRLQSSLTGKFSRILTGLTSTLSAQSVKPQVRNQGASTLYLCPDDEGKTSITVLEIS
jgi:hypothetical protein